MKLTRLAVYHPIIILTLTAALVLGGLASYANLGLEQYPQLKLPIVTVQVTYPGASAQTVEEQVTRRVEDAVAGLGNVKSMTSVSRNNLATITVEFNEGIDVDVAAGDIQQRVSGIRRELPAEAEEPSYLKLDFNDVPILYLALTSSGEPDDVELYRVADDLVRPRIETAGGVGRVVVVGGREPEVQVEVQPDRLRAYGLSLTDVANAVRSQFLSTSGGDLKSGGGTGQATLRVDSRQAGLASLGALPVAAPDGSSTELRNVANVYLGGKDAEQVPRVNGAPAAGLLVYKQSSANITQTVDTVRPLVERISAELPPGYALGVAIDQSVSIRQTVRGVEEELGLAALITGLVLFLFLHNLRSTVIVLLAIPTSFMAALIVMRLQGLSLNMLTLIGLTTAIGVLVDDSIVVLENIATHLERGQEPKQAAVDGRSEIGLAAIAITLVDVAVWGPILFITGLTGAFLRNFAIVMVASTLASLLVSFSLTPLFASRWFSRLERRSWLTRLAAFWEPLYRAAERGYGRALPWALRHRPLVLLLALGVFGANLLILPRLGSEFVPELNRDTVTVVGELPAGVSLAGADGAARRWERALLDPGLFPEVRTAYVVVGRGESDLDREPRFIAITADVGAARGRARTSSAIGKAAAEAGEQVVPGLQARLSGFRAGSTGQPIQVRVFGDDLPELTAQAARVRIDLAALPEVTYLTNSMTAAPELTVRPDPSRLKDLGLTTQQVGTAVRLAYQGVDVGRWVGPDGKERDVRVRLPAEHHLNPASLDDLPLVRRGPQLVTLRQVATTTSEDAPTRITRVDRQRVAVLGAEPNGVPLGAATARVRQAMNALELPAGTRWALAGQSEDQADAFRQLGLGLAVSVVLMYLVLTILYESVLYPLVILTALPLATVGAFVGLLAFGQTLSVPSFIGLIALFGLVGKNSILLVDRANDLRRQGLDRTAALEQAGPSRLRPILMTSAVLILSMLPVALELGDGGEIRAPLGAVLVGGMTTSTLLSLLFVPVSYTYFDSLQTLVGKLSRWRPRRGSQRAAGSSAAMPSVGAGREPAGPMTEEA